MRVPSSRERLHSTSFRNASRLSPSTGLVALVETRYKFIVFGKSEFACVYRLADLVQYDYDEEVVKNSEGKEEKKSFRFIVARMTPGNKRLWDTNLLVALEDFEITENADEGDDVLISFKLKQYKEYGVKVLKVAKKKDTTSTSNKARSGNNNSSKSQTYTVKSGDCLWNIAKKFYGSGAKYTKIYNANKTVIENTAKKYGKKSSSNGHWIYPGTKLTIPAQ